MVPIYMTEIELFIILKKLVLENKGILWVKEHFMELKIVEVAPFNSLPDY